MNFDWYNPVRLITGRGCVTQNAHEFGKLGKRCLIVTSGSAAKKSGALDDVLAALSQAGVSHLLYDQVQPNPSLLGSKEAGEMARAGGAEFVVGIGGGSPLDAAKAAAIFATNDIPAMDLYQTNWANPALPLILISTTAGTGSEVAPYAVLTNIHGKKKSISSPQIFATITFGDGRYTDSLPLSFTISTALDALSHALEGYYNTGANLLSDQFACQAVKLLYPLLTALRSLQEGSQVSPEQRDQLYYASVVAGYALAHTGTCYCHSLGYFLTEEHGVPHGIACAAYLSDFTRRGGRLLPDKAAALYQAAGCTEDQLCQCIDALYELPAIKLSPAAIQELVETCAAARNFSQTAPEGYTKEEALVLVTRMFG